MIVLESSGKNSKSIFCFKLKVGLGEAGKTSLLNALMGYYDYHKNPQVTDGIDIKDWQRPLPDNTELVYSMWDFGKKNVQHNVYLSN